VRLEPERVRALGLEPVPGLGQVPAQVLELELALALELVLAQALVLAQVLHSPQPSTH